MFSVSPSVCAHDVGVLHSLLIDVVPARMERCASVISGCSSIDAELVRQMYCEEYMALARVSGGY